MERVLLTSLLEAGEEQGQKEYRSWKKTALEKAKRDVQSVAGWSVVTPQAIKNKIDNWKKNWKIWEHLTLQSGFGVDEYGMVTGDPHALEAYFTAQPEARRFKLKPLQFAKELGQLFSVLTTGGNAVTVDDLINQTTDDTSPSPSSSSEVSSVVGSKRSAPASVTSSSKRRRMVVDQLGRLTTQLSNLVAAMQQDYQRDAIQIVELEYQHLPYKLKMALIYAFENEYTAKVFCLVGPAMRPSWVRQLLLDRREIIIGSGVDLEQFNAAIDSFE